MGNLLIEENRNDIKTIHVLPSDNHYIWAYFFTEIVRVYMYTYICMTKCVFTSYTLSIFFYQ